jgi:hypothetical protein
VSFRTLTTGARQFVVHERSRENDLLGAGLEVLLASLAVAEDAGAFQGHVHAAVAPRQVGGVFLGRHGDGGAVDHDGAVVGLHVAGEPAVGAVILEEVGQHLGVGEVVDADNGKLVLAFPHGPEDQAPDPPEAVDANVNRHPYYSLPGNPVEQEPPGRRADAPRSEPNGHRQNTFIEGPEGRCQAFSTSAAPTPAAGRSPVFRVLRRRPRRNQRTAADKARERRQPRRPGA